MIYLTRSPFFESEVAPVFRLFGELDNARRVPRAYSTRTRQPKFDVKETKEAYELHGELPGMEQKDISIEFVGRDTIKISGHSERTFTKGTPPAGLVAESKKQQSVADEAHESTTSYHSATVEDEDTESFETISAEPTAEKKPEEPETPEKEDKSKYWVTERSFGEFQRSFSFASRVDQDNVRASMKNGILSIVIPKLAPPQPRKITIE